MKIADLPGILKTFTFFISYPRIISQKTTSLLHFALESMMLLTFKEGKPMGVKDIVIPTDYEESKITGSYKKKSQQFLSAQL